MEWVEIFFWRKWKGINDVNVLKICIVTEMKKKILSKFPFKIIFINCGFLWALFYQECKSACVGVIVVSFFSLYTMKNL